MRMSAVSIGMLAPLEGASRSRGSAKAGVESSTTDPRLGVPALQVSGSSRTFASAVGEEPTNHAVSELTAGPRLRGGWGTGYIPVIPSNWKTVIVDPVSAWLFGMATILLRKEGSEPKIAAAL